MDKVHLHIGRQQLSRRTGVYPATGLSRTLGSFPARLTNKNNKGTLHGYLGYGEKRVIHMPRGFRLDAPGVLHHVMARGLERQQIFSG